MALKKLGYRTEALVNIIINKIIKDGRWIDGKLWVSITQVHLSKILKCTRECVSHHICKLVEEGVLCRERLSAKEHDHSNYYSINPGVLDNVNLKTFFSRAIVKKISNIYSIIINKSLINHNKSITRERVEKVVLMSSNGISDLKGSHASTQAATAQVEQSKEKSPVINATARSISTTTQDMLSIWNEELERKDGLSKQLSRYLVACYQRKFGSSLEAWRKYVRGLKGSAYVMGNLLERLGDRLLSWALSFKVINRIFSGGFGVTLEEHKAADECAEDSAVEHIESLSESDSCKAIRREVLEAVGPVVYLSWFKKVSLEEFGNKILLRGASFITNNVHLRYLRNYSQIVDAGESCVCDAEAAASETELISQGYVGASRIKEALFGRR